jgi:ABC-type dipeptide/oligopeptide/nickel transport system permease subunit
MSVAVQLPLPRRRDRAQTLRLLLRRPPAVAALTVVAVLLLAVLVGPVIAGGLTNDYSHLFAGPSWQHWFGTDELGRDLFTRMLSGGRLTFAIAASATALATVAGTVWGFAAAFREGWVDEILMRIADVALAVPAILFGLILVAAFGASPTSLAVILGVLFTPPTARVARAAVLSELRSDYYLAAVSVGAPSWRILLEELLPNAAPVLLAQASLTAAGAIFTEASLSLVGLGVQPPQASWGTLLEYGYKNMYQSLAYVLCPAAVIFVAIFALNVLGDELQAALDPSRRR